MIKIIFKNSKLIKVILFIILGIIFNRMIKDSAYINEYIYKLILIINKMFNKIIIVII